MEGFPTWTVITVTRKCNKARELRVIIYYTSYYAYQPYSPVGH